MPEPRDNQYRLIRDYAVIGNARTVALIASNGSIDWCCWPEFDSPAVFCRLLDARKGGWFRISPAQRSHTARSYRGDSNILSTVFTTEHGQARLTDFMPMDLAQPDRKDDATKPSRLLRLVEGVSGRVELEVGFRPTFDYARARTKVTPCDGGAVATAGEASLILASPVPLAPGEDGALRGNLSIKAGQRAWFELRDAPSGRPVKPHLRVRDAEAALEATQRYWEQWIRRCRYEGPYQSLVRRSALTLKLLTFEPTGALVAAPTTSLPEQLGGVRNWDYRYTWLRDSALTLDALEAIGYRDEAMRFFSWLESLEAREGRGLQIMYTVRGGHQLPERTLRHLEGYRGSRPVRVGNLATRQVQVDVYGQILDAIAFHYRLMPRPMDNRLWETVRFFADQAATRWREPDQGMWEMRTAPQHFVYSKLYCWVAMDRALWIAESQHKSGDVKQRRRVREQIRHAILAEGYNEEVGAFTQTFGGRALDASALMIPLVKFLPASDPRVHSTMQRVREHLGQDGLVHRYLTDDGLPGNEGMFTLCSFWLIDNLALSGRLDEAQDLFQHITRYAGPLGLFSEEIDPATGDLLGNYPQGYAHLALIRSAQFISSAAHAREAA